MLTPELGRRTSSVPSLRVGGVRRHSKGLLAKRKSVLGKLSSTYSQSIGCVLGAGSWRVLLVCSAEQFQIHDSRKCNGHPCT